MQFSYGGFNRLNLKIVEGIARFQLATFTYTPMSTMLICILAAFCLLKT